VSVGVALGEALQTTKTLTSLRLGVGFPDHLSEVEIKVAFVGLCEGLKTNSSIVDLCIDFGHAIYGAEEVCAKERYAKQACAEALRDALKVNRALTSLKLGGILEDSHEFVGVALGEALQTNATLTSLCLSMNRAYRSKAAFVALCKRLETNSTITTLCIDGAK
jgi:hypothetical protein